MGLCVLSASMDKNGTAKLQPAPVNQVINGTDNIVKSLIYVRMEESGAQLSSSAYAQKDTIGVDINVYQALNVLEANILTQPSKNVSAFLVFNGMVKFVFNVEMVEYGMSQHYHAHALSEHLK